MALSYGKPGIFLPITVVTFFVFGERGPLDFSCAVLVSVYNLRPGPDVVFVPALTE